MTGASIIIVAYKSGQHLTGILSNIEQYLSTDEYPIEVIIVDNSTTSSDKELVLGFQKQTEFKNTLCAK